MIQLIDNYKDKNIKDVIIKKEDTELTIFFGGNQDLYFTIKGRKELLDDDVFNKKVDLLIKNEDEEWLCFNRLINKIIEDKNSQRVGLVKGKEINWYSDDGPLETANLLLIKRENEGIRLSFFNNPNERHYGIAIRICNSGSRYNPFNLQFMEMYHEIRELGIQKSKKIDDEQR
ncbi:MAG: hypothetical protein IKF97_04715 [Clostridia bacterium]|nr:hypothetical protein [Clostridia bacterium]